MASNSIGIRELKAQLSAHLRRVKAGGTVVITEHGRPIGWIVPVPMDLPDRLRVLVESGIVQWNGQHLLPAKPVAEARGGRTVAGLLLDDRG